MKAFAQLAFGMATAALCLPAAIAGLPNEYEKTAADPRQLAVVVLKYDGNYTQFAVRAQEDKRALADPQAWGYLDKGVVGAVQALEKTHQFQARHVYSHAIRGFAADLTPEQIQALRNDSSVERVDLDLPVSAIPPTLSWNMSIGGGTPAAATGSSSDRAVSSALYGQQWPSPPGRTYPQKLPWGVERIGAHLSSTRSGDGTGRVTGVHVYMFDTGVFIDPNYPVPADQLNMFGHVNFTGDGYNFDLCSWGTHVAGTIGARDDIFDIAGVAPGVPLVAVKVLACNGTGSSADVIKGIDWVTAVSLKPSVANLRLNGVAFTPLDDAVQRSAAMGVFYVIAAGDSSRDACDFSPARAGRGMFNGIVTVAASDATDREASFSNHGDCVDLWAPGVSILSFFRTTWFWYTLWAANGTLTAAPHVAGTAALLLSRNPALSPSETEQILKATARYPGTTSRDGRPIALVNARFF